MLFPFLQSPKISMARILLISGLFFVIQLIRADAQDTFVPYGCDVPSNSTGAILAERNQFLTEFLYNITFDIPTLNMRFFNVTTGDTPNKVYVLFHCREDVGLDQCWLCLYNAQEKIVNLCSVYNEGVVWYEDCMLRFAYRNIFSLNETSPSIREWNFDNVSNYADFSPVLAKTMDGIIKNAAISTNRSHFATSEINVSSGKFYCFAQCTPDLDRLQCQTCLQSALANISDDCCNTSIEQWIFFPSCQLRYSNKPLPVKLEESFAPSPSMLPPVDQGVEDLPTNNKNRSMKPGIIVAICSAAATGIVLLVVGLWLCRHRTKPEEPIENFSDASTEVQDVVAGTMDDISSLESLQFDFTVVKASTCNFSEENKLGQGGFGEVYKGQFPNGEEIAVKRLSKHSQQGSSEFKNEVILLAKLQHRNLVKLLGFSILREEKILIYEFLSNSSLDRFLYDPLKRASLDWELRFKIIIGIARGLLYLHEDSRLKIIHRDLKVSNILLDEAMNAKIADFGLAKLFDFDQTQGDTLRIAGTYGYMAPEYALAGQFSVKSDVYSFGVIILEIVSGQKNSFFQRQSDEALLFRAWRLWKEDTTLELVDPLLGNNFLEEEVKLCIRIGLLCVQEEATHRPRMASVVSALNGHSITLPLPNAPHFYAIGVVTEGTSSNFDSLPVTEVQQEKSDYSTGAHTGPTNVSDICPR